jgi:hypothetical protein
MSFWIQHPDLEYNDQNHLYLWKGKEKRSVTSVLSSVATKKVVNGIAHWKPVGFDSRWVGEDETASNFGSAFHKVWVKSFSRATHRNILMFYRRG